MLRHALLVAGMLGAIGIAATALANVNADDVRIAARAERTWPDSRLGCGSGLGLGRSAVDGYAFTVKSAKGHFEYHTNRFGDVQRCRTVRTLAP